MHYLLAYRTDDGKPWVLPIVRQMEKQMAGRCIYSLVICFNTGFKLFECLLQLMKH